MMSNKAIIAAATALIKLCTKKQLKIATAESCTGGLVAGALTEVPGSSAVLERGFVTYSNDAKWQMLSVPADTLEKHGAVSRETAEAMAMGARERTGSTYAVAITGVAGPTGSEAKPVGTVFVAVADSAGVHVAHRRFVGDRARIRAYTAQMALDTLRRRLIGKP
jgi:PncC family amidohydrolase